jgi:hypothetical protein
MNFLVAQRNTAAWTTAEAARGAVMAPGGVRMIAVVARATRY